MSKSIRLHIRILNARGAVIAQHEIEKFPCVIGRGLAGEKDIDADVPLDDPRCSRAHALIERAPDGLNLTDQGSTNGTFNSEGKRVGKLPLRGKTKLRIGHHWIELIAEDDEERTLVDSAERQAREDESTQASLPKIEMDRQEEAAGSQSGEERSDSRGESSEDARESRESRDEEEESQLPEPYDPESDEVPRAPWEKMRPSKKKRPERRRAKAAPIPKTKAVKPAPRPEPAPTPAAARERTFSDDDLLERAFHLISSRGAMSGTLFFACIHVALWEPGGWVGKGLVVGGTAALTLIAATLLGLGSTLFSKLSPRPMEFGPIWRAYVTLIAVRQLCAWLAYDATLMWPAHHYLEPWVPMLGTAMLGIFVCLNIRWVFAWGPRLMGGLAAVWGLAMLVVYVPDLRPQPPLWQKVVSTPQLNAQPRRLPSSVQVPEAQFLHELSESLVVLQDSDKPAKKK